MTDSTAPLTPADAQKSINTGERPRTELERIIDGFGGRIKSVMEKGTQPSRNLLSMVTRAQVREEAPEAGQVSRVRLTQLATRPQHLQVDYLKPETGESSLERECDFIEGEIAAVTENIQTKGAFAATSSTVVITRSEAIFSQQISNLGQGFNNASRNRVKTLDKSGKPVVISNPETAGTIGFVATITPEGQTTNALKIGAENIGFSLPPISATEEMFSGRSSILIKPIGNRVNIHPNVSVQAEVHLVRVGVGRYEYQVRFSAGLASTENLKSPGNQGDFSVQADYIPSIRVPDIGLYGIERSLASGMPLTTELRPENPESYISPNPSTGVTAGVARMGRRT